MYAKPLFTLLATFISSHVQVVGLGESQVSVKCAFISRCLLRKGYEATHSQILSKLTHAQLYFVSLAKVFWAALNYN